MQQLLSSFLRTLFKDGTSSSETLHIKFVQKVHSPLGCTDIRWPSNIYKTSRSSHDLNMQSSSVCVLARTSA